MVVATQPFGDAGSRVPPGPHLDHPVGGVEVVELVEMGRRRLWEERTPRGDSERDSRGSCNLLRQARQGVGPSHTDSSPPILAQPQEMSQYERNERILTPAWPQVPESV